MSKNYKISPHRHCSYTYICIRYNLKKQIKAITMRKDSYQKDRSTLHSWISAAPGVNIRSGVLAAHRMPVLIVQDSMMRMYWQAPTA